MIIKFKIMTIQDRKDLAEGIYNYLNTEKHTLTVKDIEIAISDFFNDLHTERCEAKRDAELYSLDNLIDQDPNG